MAVASDYSGWVRELDNFQASVNGDDVDDDFDPRHETSDGRGGASTSRQTSRISLGIGTSRKGKERAVSQSDELQQEMKLLNWHKLANEAALKAAIIKTNKIKREDSHLSRSMNHEDMEDKQLRIQQIIEEEQLRPLEVNSEFFRDFESKELQDEAKLDNDVQRHVQHLKKLKETMVQREDTQRRRQKYREGMLELNGSRSNSVPKNHKSNQDDERHEQLSNKRHQRSNSMYNNRSANGSGANNTTQVICSLDKLMELEKRIRHLEDAGLGADALEDDPRIEHGSRGGDELEESNLVKAKGGLHFSKRRSNGGPHEPSKTVYAVKTSAGGGISKINKMRAKEKPRAAPATRQRQPQGTFLTSLPESKQRQLRRMTERERRQFMKQEKASDERDKNLKQDVVIDGWLDKKRQAATNRKATTTHVRNAQAGARGTMGTNSSANAATGRRLGGKALPPPPPRVRAPAAGAASGKRIANPHSQKFDNIKRGFEKRNEALKRAPTNVKASSSLLDARLKSGGTTLHSSTSSGNQQRSGNNSNNSSSKWGIASDRNPSGAAGSTSAAQRSAGVFKASTLSNVVSGNRAASYGSSVGKGLTPTAPVKKSLGGSGSSHTHKLPAIVRPSGASTGGLQFGLTNRNPTVAMTSAVNPVQHANQRTGTTLGVALPRLTTQTARGLPAPSPPPLALKNSSMPQFSRLHKR